MCNLSWTPHSNLEKDNSLKTTPVLAQRWTVWSILTIRTSATIKVVEATDVRPKRSTTRIHVSVRFHANVRFCRTSCKGWYPIIDCELCNFRRHIALLCFFLEMHIMPKT